MLGTVRPHCHLWDTTAWFHLCLRGQREVLTRPSLSAELVFECTLLSQLWIYSLWAGKAVVRAQFASWSFAVFMTAVRGKMKIPRKSEQSYPPPHQRSQARPSATMYSDLLICLLTLWISALNYVYQGTPSWYIHTSGCLGSLVFTVTHLFMENKHMAWWCVGYKLHTHIYIYIAIFYVYISNHRWLKWK